jgi:hypothetical protein
MSAEFAKFMQDFFSEFAKRIQLGLPARIIRFDKSKMRADVEFYLQSENEKGIAVNYPVISDLPVQFVFAGGYYIRPDYQYGDKVWVTFSTFDISDALYGVKSIESGSLFNLNNAVVSGGIAENNFTPPSEFSAEDGLLIGEKSGNAFMIFGKESIKMKFSKGGITHTFDATGIRSGADIQWSDGAHSGLSHVHSVVGPIVTGPPIG